MPSYSRNDVLVRYPLSALSGSMCHVSHMSRPPTLQVACPLEEEAILHPLAARGSVIPAALYDAIGHDELPHVKGCSLAMPHRLDSPVAFSRPKKYQQRLDACCSENAERPSMARVNDRA